MWTGAPRLALAEPEDQKRRLLAGGFVTFLHGAIAALLFAIAALAPAEFVESVIPVALIPMPMPEPVELPGTHAEPAPAGPKQIGAQRANAAQLAASQILTPSQAAAMRRDALSAAQRSIEQMNVESAVLPSLPTEITRKDVQAETVAARTATTVAPSRSVDVRAVAPVKLDAAQLAATPRDLAGPRAIDRSSLTDLSSRDALAGLERESDSDSARYDGTLAAGSVAASGASAGDRVAVGIDTGVAGAWATGGTSGGTGGESGATGGAEGTGGDGDALGMVRCLESASVQRYLERVQQRTSQRWIVPAGVSENTAVVLRFELDAAGMANHVESRGGEGDTSALPKSARQALLSAAPFAPLDDSNRCLIEKRIVLTFTVPTP